jgi:transposase
VRTTCATISSCRRHRDPKVTGRARDAAGAPVRSGGDRRRLIVRELIAELRAVDRKIVPLDADIAWMLDEHGTTLCDIVGIGRTGAATILAITGDPTRFRSAAAYA